jgi:predicted RNA-binding Zn-ribbon protein involved in translation (DUF1610 family)
LKPNPPEHVRWCDLGCGAEIPTDTLREGVKCPKCGERTVDLGYRYRDSKGVVCYASTWETLPVEVRRAA